MKKRKALSKQEDLNIGPLSLNQYWVEMVYLILLRRIAAGYTSAELAFLIGKPASFIEEIETYGCDDISIDDLHSISHVLGTRLHTYFWDKDEIRAKLNIKFSRKYHKSRIYHQVDLIREDQSAEILFKFMEEDQDAESRPFSVEYRERQVSDLREVLATLIEEGYFAEPNDAFTLFEDCREKLTGNFSADDLRKALAPFVGRGKDKKLKQVKRYRMIRYKAI